MRNNAHELNLDVAYREIASREADGEDMSRASVNHKTYAIEFLPKVAVITTELDLRRGYEADGLTEREIEAALDQYEAAEDNPQDLVDE